MLARDVVFHRIAELCEQFQTKRLRKASSATTRAWRFDGLGSHHELRVFAGELLLHVVLGKSHLQRAGFAGGDPDELILEAWNERVRPDEHNRVVARTSFERCAVNRARKGDRHAIILGRLLARGRAV